MTTPFIADVYEKLAEIFYESTAVTKLERDCAKALVKGLLRSEDPERYGDTLTREYRVKDPSFAVQLVKSIANGWISEAGWSMDHGVWDHFKGGTYLSDRVERCADTGEPRVSYLSLIYATRHSRRASQWNEVVQWSDGVWRSRFVYRGASLETPAPTFKVVGP